MRFGCCASYGEAATLRRLGFDFIELPVSDLAPEGPPEEFERAARAVESAGIRAEAFNRLLPGTLPIVGPTVDEPRLRSYLATSLSRAARLGGRVVVWGSPQSRHVPSGFSPEAAFGQIAEALRFAAGVAEAEGLVLAIEPLDARSTNTIHTLADGASLARSVNHPAVQVIADVYHMALNGDPPSEIPALGSLLAHVHVSDRDRRPPGSDPGEFERYEQVFALLSSMGYDGRVSIEARFSAFPMEAERALKVLRDCAGRAKGEG